MTDPDPMKFAEDLKKWAQGLQQQAQRYGEWQEQLDATTVSARSPDDAVRVTVDSNGVPTDLTITERGRDVDPAELSSTLMATLQQAQTELRERVSEMATETVGDDEPANEIVTQYRERFPDSVEEDNSEPPMYEIGQLEEEPHESVEPEESPEPQEPQGSEEPQPRRRRRSADEDDGDDYFGGSILQ